MDTSAAAAPPMPTPEAAEEIQELAEAAELRAAEHADALAADNVEPIVAENAESLTPLEPLEPFEPFEPLESLEPSAISRLGVEGVKRLRARYTDIIQRLEEKEMDDAARAELKTSAARLNPDAWNTPEEVTAALEQYEAVFESLRSVVGRHPRSRKR